MYSNRVSISSVISTSVSIVCNLVFLLYFKWGLYGYFYAFILGPLLQCIYLITSFNLWHLIRDKNTDKNLQKEMKNYSSPMIANAVSWWVNNASDRYVVTWISGVAANGIYSVSYKIPSIISVLQNIFGQAWSISAVNEFDRNDESHFYINVYNAYNSMLVFSCSVLILLDKALAKLLFAKEFFNAWIYVPFLLISVIFSGMSAFIGGLFSALKDSKTFARTSTITAVVNTIGNIILTYYIGPQGAAISTAIAYFIMWILRIKEVRKSINLRVNFKRDLFSYLVITIQAILLITIDKDAVVSFYQIFFVLPIVFLYKNELIALFNKFKFIILDK